MRRFLCALVTGLMVVVGFGQTSAGAQPESCPQHFVREIGSGGSGPGAETIIDGGASGAACFHRPIAIGAAAPSATFCSNIAAGRGFSRTIRPSDEPISPEGRCRTMQALIDAAFSLSSADRA